APLTLDEIIAEIETAHRDGAEVARVHSGDPSIYGAIAEQMRRLDRLGIPYDVTPGVPAFAAAAAALRRELTLPSVAQTVVLTRGTLADIRDQVKAAGITRTALILVGPALAGEQGRESRLYAPEHYHVYRPRRPAI